MLKQKLITLAGTLGILACGACFRDTYKPPPPPALAKEGIRNLRVVLIDVTEQHRINLPVLAGLVVLDLNDQGRSAGVRATARDNPRADAILEVTIHSLSAAPQTTSASDERQSWGFTAQTSATLRRINGEVIWRSRTLTQSPRLDSYTRDEEAMWKDPITQGALLREIGFSLSNASIYQLPRLGADPGIAEPSHPEPAPHD